MHRHRSCRRRPSAPRSSLRALRYWHPVALRNAVARGRLVTTGGAGGVLVTAREDSQQIARAAWSIVKAMGGLVDRGDIARRYGLSRGRVHQLTGQRHFPEPVDEVGGRPVWLAIDVERYRAQPPPVGRPRKTSSDGDA